LSATRQRLVTVDRFPSGARRWKHRLFCCYLRRSSTVFESVAILGRHIGDSDLRRAMRTDENENESENESETRTRARTRTRKRERGKNESETRTRARTRAKTRTRARQERERDENENESESKSENESENENETRMDENETRTRFRGNTPMWRRIVDRSRRLPTLHGLLVETAPPVATELLSVCAVCQFCSVHIDIRESTALVSRLIVCNTCAKRQFSVTPSSAELDGVAKAFAIDRCEDD